MSNSKKANTQVYSLTLSNVNIEDENIIVYGIKQTYITDDNEQVETIIENVSEEKIIVNNLIEFLSKEDVYFSSLQDIVEDYIEELYGETA